MAYEHMIGALAKRTGTKVQTIRYYEDIGVMPLPMRAANNRRIYNDSHLERLTFIRHSRSLGFSLDAIRELLALTDDKDRPCAEVDQIARSHLDAVRRKVAALKTLESELERMVGVCAGGSVGDCRIVKVLADHSLCNDQHQ